MAAKKSKKKKRPKDALGLSASLRSLLHERKLGPYISHIRFPRFKNIRRGARLDFSFPVTALVGPNGCGKTSALHALYGAPKGESTSDYWFATKLDPIEEGDGEPNRFIYAHWLEGQDAPVETRKSRVGKSRRRKPGYFEPTKAVIVDGMDMSPFPADGSVPGQSKDRWNPVVRNRLYINFRSELSAFDKYLFFGWHTPTKTLRSKQDRLQLGAKRVRQALDSEEETADFRGREVVHRNRLLDDRELKAVCGILGKEYTEARIIEHDYYGWSTGLSVRFRTPHSTYSEAFAGSGELAVSSLVTQLCDAEEHSLVLLDEPEVSLHPGAQERMLLFLLSEAVRKKHQIIFTTHAPGMVRLLPPDAVKVFYETDDGTFDVLAESHPYAAFQRLGAPAPDRIRVFVEDRLALKVVALALLELDEHERKLFEIDYLPGGSKTYFAHRIPTLMHEGPNTYVLLDGDQAPTDEVPEPRDIPESGNDSLLSTIEGITDCKDIKFGFDGGDDEEATAKRYKLQRKYLGFLRNQVRFLPRSCPEEIVLHAVKASNAALESQMAKTKLAAQVHETMGSDTSDAVDNYAQVVLAQNRTGNADLKQIAVLLREWLGRMT